MKASGPPVFAMTMMALGILGLMKGGFTPMWAGVPRGMPGRDVLAWLTGSITLVSGIGLLWRRTAAGASRLLLAVFLVWLLSFRMAQVVLAPTSLIAWWACGDTAVMVAASWVLYARFTGERAEQRSRLGFLTGDRGVRIARMVYGLALIPFGIAHFAYLERTAPLVPAWLPFPVGWAYFTGGAFIAAGAGILTGVFARLAAALSAVQLGLFTVLVWVPIVASGPDPSQWNEFVNSWTLTAGAWVVAESYRGSPWLGGLRADSGPNRPCSERQPRSRDEAAHK